VPWRLGAYNKTHGFRHPGTYPQAHRGFPKTPGVYLMKGADGRVLYVGKAKELRSR